MGRRRSPSNDLLEASTGATDQVGASHHRQWTVSNLTRAAVRNVAAGCFSIAVVMQRSSGPVLVKGVRSLSIIPTARPDAHKYISQNGSDPFPILIEGGTGAIRVLLPARYPPNRTSPLRCAANLHRSGTRRDPPKTPLLPRDTALQALENGPRLLERNGSSRARSELSGRTSAPLVHRAFRVRGTRCRGQGVDKSSCGPFGLSEKQSRGVHLRSEQRSCNRNKPRLGGLTTEPS
jgi:hypothetical protein